MSAAAGGRHALVQVQLTRRTRQGWVPSPGELARWADAALGRAARGCEVSVLLVGPQRSRSLNARYRGRDHATNVLSFPAPARRGGQQSGGRHVRQERGTPARLLGDLVICPAVLCREARLQRKSERAHWAHLVVHGVLHLIGFDHEEDADARRMERREVRALQGLGFANPYRST